MGFTETDKLAPASLSKDTTPRGASLLPATLPIVGVILAIVAWARGRVGPGLALITTSALASFAWTVVLALDHYKGGVA